MVITSRHTLLALLSASFVFASSAAAQGYPVKPVRIVVPYPPGGSTDAVFRILAPRLTEILGQQAVVENRPGGSSTIGVNFVAKSPPDGYTLGAVNIAFSANPSLMVHIPYKGGGPSVLSLVTGETALLLASIASVIQHFQSGKLVSLAVGSLKRNVALPDVPSIAEAAIPGFEAIEWIGVVVPAGTPPAVIGRLHQALAKALSIPEEKERIPSLGMDPVGNSPQEFSAFIKKELATWSKVIKEVGITID